MKFLTILLIVIGMVVIFNMAGFTTESGNLVAGFLSQGFAYFTSSEFWNKGCSGLSECASSIPIILTIGLGAGAIAGFFGRSPDISYVVGGLAYALMTILVIEMGALWSMISPLVDGWIFNVMALIFLILTIGMIVSGISWFRGSDG